nr:basic salivary proline-rich protein 2-like [Cavia porcellus]
MELEEQTLQQARSARTQGGRAGRTPPPESGFPSALAGRGAGAEARAAPPRRPRVPRAPRSRSFARDCRAGTPGRPLHALPPRPERPAAAPLCPAPARRGDPCGESEPRGRRCPFRAGGSGGSSGRGHRRPGPLGISRGLLSVLGAVCWGSRSRKVRTEIPSNLFKGLAVAARNFFLPSSAYIPCVSRCRLIPFPLPDSMASLPVISC